MSYRIHLRPDPPYRDLRTNLDEAAKLALAHLNAPPGELSIVLTDEQRSRALNQQFGGTDAPTDVLSFSNGSIDPDSGLHYYGDVVIAIPVAKEQASQAGHSLQAEITLLMVHGILHLLGYDHRDPAETEKMWSMQAQIMQHLGLAHCSPKRQT
jgi:probable rRNA maturation factor